VHALNKSKGAATIVGHAILEMLFVAKGQNTWFDRFQNVAAEPSGIDVGINRAEASSSGCAAFLRRYVPGKEFQAEFE
jgi:hypothetical protein